MTAEALMEQYPEINLIQDTTLRGKCVNAFLYGLEKFGWEQRGGLENCPVNVGILPPDTPATNLEHIRSATRACDCAFQYLQPWLSELGYEADYNITMAGILMHDIGKLIEYSRDQNNHAVYSATGPLFRHTVSGAYLCKKADMPDAVTHLVLTHSHSQAPEGANAFETPEAVMVKCADLVSWSIIELVYKR